MQRWNQWLVILALMLGTAGCASVGHEFPKEQVGTIQIGKTTMDDIRDTFGAPWRVGIENGQKTWTYGKYQYNLFSPAKTTDLVIRFNDQGVVQAYNYNTTDHSQ